MLRDLWTEPFEVWGLPQPCTASTARLHETPQVGSNTHHSHVTGSRTFLAVHPEAKCLTPEPNPQSLNAECKHET